MITRDSIESAYSFLHQKLRVYDHSTCERQRDDIEYAIAQYVNDMSRELYGLLAEGREGFLMDHTTFDRDMHSAVSRLEQML